MGVPTLPLHMRKALPEDYPALAEIHHASRPPSWRQTADGLRRLDERSTSVDPACHRWIAEEDGRLVAMGWLRDCWWGGEQETGRYWTEIQVLPDRRDQGVDAALLRHMVDQRGPGVAEVLALVREDGVEDAPYLRTEAFRLLFRSWGAWLDVGGFDPSPHLSLLQGLEAEGVRLLSYEALADDPDRDHKLAELKRRVSADVLAFDPIVPSLEHELLDPDSLPQGTLIAVDRAGDYLGLSCLKGRAGEDDLGFGLTGVLRAHRGRGIATALKVRCIEVARASGCRRLGTGGGGGHEAPMRRLNRKLGFEMEPAWHTYGRRFA